MERQLIRDGIINEITCRLVDYFHPERVYLFGSAARGDWSADSDLNFCVVLSDDAPDAHYRAKAYGKALKGIGAAAGVVRLPIGNFDARAEHVAASRSATVVREGKLLYDAAQIAAKSSLSECSAVDQRFSGRLRDGFLRR